MTAFTLNWIREGLHGRAYTRDLNYGVPIPEVIEPLDHEEDKRIYVWFDAVSGYLSAAKEWAALKGDPDAWKEWWLQAEGEPAPSKSYYFIGKDNISFHTIIWPSMLIGYGGLMLPYDVPANEFLTGERGEKGSTSRGGGGVPWLPDFLDRYKPDPLRYFLTVNAPENPRHRLLVGRVLPPQQRRAGSHLRQPRPPHAHLHRHATSTAKCRSPARSPTPTKPSWRAPRLRSTKWALCMEALPVQGSPARSHGARRRSQPLPGRHRSLEGPSRPTASAPPLPSMSCSPSSTT